MSRYTYRRIRRHPFWALPLFLRVDGYANVYSSFLRCVDSRGKSYTIGANILMNYYRKR